MVKKIKSSTPPPESMNVKTNMLPLEYFSKLTLVIRRKALHHYGDYKTL